MRNAQEHALALLASQRGLIGPLELREVEALARARALSLAEALVLAHRVQPQGVGALLQELAGREFACQGGCGRALTWDALAGLPDLRCACGHTLVTRARLPLGVGGQSPLGNSGPGSGSDTDLQVAALTPPGEPPRRMVGPYQLVRELGRGSNGVVWLAEKPGLERQFAVKVLHESELGDAESVARFKLEAAIASKLDETGVIGVYDIGHDGRSWYYAMEYCPGETLEDRIGRGTLPPNEAADVVAALARTMEQAHQQGVIHRDLKPANVILDARSGRPRITDFGLARDPTLLRALTRSGDVLGTPYYMAPEQLLGEGKIDHRIDVYALGVILYEALCGQRPYKAANFVELTDRVRRQPPPELRERAPEVPPALAAVCARAMARKRGDRYLRARDLADDLERFLKGEVPQAVSHPSRELQGAPGPRLPLLLGLVLGAALLGGAAGAGLHLARRAPSEEPAAPPGPAVGPTAPATGGAEAVEARLEEARALDARDAPAPEVLDALAQALALADGDELRLRVRTQRGAAALRRSHLDLALEDARFLLEGEGRPAAARVEGLWLRGQALLRLGRRDEALAPLEDLALLDPDGPRGQCAAAIRLRLGGDPMRGLARAQAASAGKEPFLPALLEQALILLQARRPASEVAGPLRAAEAVDPSDPRLLLGLATLGWVQGARTEAVLGPLERALSLCAPEADPQALELRARLMLRQGQLAAAMTDLERVLERCPNQASPWFLHGVAAWQVGDKGRAAEDWVEAWCRDPAVVASELVGLDDRALEALARERLGLEPGELPPPPPRWTVGPALRERLEARASAAGPAADDLREALVRAAEGRPWAEVAPAFARADARDPHSAVVALERARVLVGREQFDMALGAIHRARDLGADVGECLRLEGAVWFHRGKRNEAVKLWESRRDDSVEGLCAAAYAAFTRQNEQDTEQLVQRVLERDPDHVPTLLLSFQFTYDPAALQRLEERILDLNGLIDGHVLSAGYHKAVGKALGGRVPERGTQDAKVMFTPETLRAVLQGLEQMALVCRGAGALARAAETAMILPTTGAGAPKEVQRRMSHRARRYLREAQLREPERGEVWMWQGLYDLMTGADKERVLARWRHAREVEPRIQIRPDWVGAFGDRFGETDSLQALSLPVDPSGGPEEQPR